jgi:hypothetical protein
MLKFFEVLEKIIHPVPEDYNLILINIAPFCTSIIVLRFRLIVYIPFIDFSTQSHFRIAIVLVSGGVFTNFSTMENKLCCKIACTCKKSTSFVFIDKTKTFNDLHNEYFVSQNVVGKVAVG